MALDLSLPTGYRLRLDPATARLPENVLLGGSPFRIVRLSPPHAEALTRWQDGEPTDATPGMARFARALVATGLAQPEPPAPVGRLTVSVIIPVRDRPRELDRLLAAVRAHQNTDPVAEIVVVDDASGDADAHERVATTWGAQLVRRPSQGRAAAARNDGAAVATSDVLAFVDSDCVPRPGWLSSAVPHFADPLVAAVAPRIVAHAGPDPRRNGWLARYEGDRSPLDRGPLPARVVPGGRVPFVPTAALVVRSTAFGEGFDTDLRGGEDVDFVWRLTGRGWHVRYEPAGEVEHEHRTSVDGFLSRRAYYGRTAAPLARRHPGAARPMAVSPWTAAAWGAVALGRPLTGAVVTAAAAGLLARQLRGVLHRPVRASMQLAGGGTVRSGEVVADACLRAWWPVSVAAFAVFPRLRPALAVGALVPGLLEWRRERPALDPVRWIAARRLDDAAYGLGVWQGCLAEGVWDPLRPDLGWKLRVLTSDELTDDHGAAPEL